ncbi:MAG TPA: peroxiredoxin [Candidatus Nitrosotenuis sp.]|jgi:peroxiredoxin (alkyl hydroperoxide reductase subunit C)|nr:peroxiredoxin [Candidatus Nitrosotenuis sp.]
MAVLVGKKAPDFKATAVYPDGFKEIQLKDFSGKYVLLFFYPLDFTFVCPTELLAFQQIKHDLEKLNVVLLGCSVDSHFSHHAWLNTPRENGGIKGVDYGLISDIGGKIAHDYDVLSEQHIAYRGLFLIDKEGIVRHQLINDLPLGRSVDEALRVVQALQHVEEHGEVCPANWDHKEPAIKPTLTSVSSYLKQRFG